MEFGFEILTLLFVVAIIAGWVDAIAGGGGLITIPILILAGLSPVSALATNKLQGSIGTLTASLYFIRKKTVNLKKMRLAILATFIGSVFGSWLLLQINTQHLIIMLPILLICMGLYFLFSPNINDEDRQEKIKVVSFALFVTPFLGFYDGFFGPGTGSFMALAFVMLLGYGLPKATANAKILNFVSNISSLSYFVIFGDVNWVAGFIMMFGQFIGAMLGARMILNNGSTLIKPVVVVVCFFMSINLLFKAYG